MTTTAQLEDINLVCRECNSDFIWTVGEQQFFHDRKLKNTPKRCQECRSKKPTQPIPQQQTMRGTVKWFNAAKGFGFITAPEYERDVYVHFSSIVAHGYVSLIAGQEVEFNLVETPKGPAAAHVRILEAI